MGLVAIEDIEVGDLVLSMDEETGETVTQPVTEVYVSEAEELFRLELADGVGDFETLTTTAEHPFFALSGDTLRWTPAQELVVGQEVLSSSSGWLVVGSATRIQESALVYNFTVAETHTYFVGEFEATVHNTCPVPSGLIRGAAEARQAVPAGSLRNFSPARGSTRSPGHAFSKHGIRVNDPAVLSVRNNPARTYIGTNSNGNPVAVFWRDGSVVITELGDTQSVITAYGRFSGRNPSIVSDRWASNPNFHLVD